MNPYQFEVKCDVCGKGGMTTLRAASNRWLGGKLRHSDPEVCAENLRRERERLEVELHKQFNK